MEQFEHYMNKFFRWLLNSLIVYWAVLCLIGLGGCDAHTSRNDSSYVIPEGLKDCAFYWVTPKGGGGFTLVRCPNSTTTAAKTGKGGWSSVTIDGQDYEIRKKE